jgi:ethanolamine-phosphate cytidylyltransferase
VCLGDFLVVGLYDDPTVKAIEGSNYPVMTLAERFLSLLACKFVSEVMPGAPYVVTKELISHLDVSVVAHGKTADPASAGVVREST